MGKVLITESHLLDIADAIREKNGLTTKYKPSEMSSAINAISTGGELTNYRRYTGVREETVIGSDAYRTLLFRDSLLAQHYLKDSFRVEARFYPTETYDYAILGVSAYNIPAQEPDRFSLAPPNKTYQYTLRQTNSNAVPLPIKETISNNYVARIQVDGGGALYIYNGKGNYGVAAGSYVVEIFW